MISQAAGINRMALIVPKSAVANIGVKNIMTKVEGTDLETAYFDNIEKAKAWLRSWHYYPIGRNQR